ncbi:MAG TPA: hypothetical protein DEV93_02450 [Chloroflexi bacterium]|jgi:hypothetical protein|nr:hypothetical protein [Chloroflexota bacterium]
MPKRRGDSNKTKPVQVDVTRFTSVDDAIQQANGVSAKFKGLAKQVILADPGNISPLPLFLLSAIARANGLHVAAINAIETTNPHAAFPLIRAYADVVIMTLYIRDHPTYAEVVMAHPGDPNYRRRVSVGRLMVAVKDYAPGVKTVYDELTEGTHFGSIAMWTAWTLSGERTLNYTTAPRWRRPETDPLVFAGWLIELGDAFIETVESTVGHYLTGDTADNR